MSLKYRDKIRLKKDIFKNLIIIDNVLSVTLVGSFWESRISRDFSDIDIVIILKKFSKKTYDQCLSKIRNIKIKKYGLENLKIFVNPTFGPLKFNNKENIVFHTMIYDVHGHINHVIKSPFTCYEWERSTNYIGKSLKEIFPVGKIQLVDFLKSRRSINSYLNNIKENYISYQKYFFKKNKYKLKNKKFKINDRHKIEFSFHLCKFLIINYYKFEQQTNKLPSKNKIKIIFTKIFGKQHNDFFKKFEILKFLKKEKKYESKIDIFIFLQKFIRNFQKYLENYEKQDIIFLRHAKTKCNNGTFLGIGRDPDIINRKKVYKKLNYLKKNKTIFVYSSTLKRSISTAETLIKKEDIILNNLLMEKNYGLAEGLTFSQFKKKYPSIIINWSKNKDPRFPLGENDSDILKRIKFFEKILKKNIRKNSNQSTNIIVTHNALLRCLIGNIFNIPKYLWVKIIINHIEPLNFIFKDKKIIPNINRINLFKNLAN